MKLKVLAGYNRFKSDNVFFSGVEVAETSDKYENKQFSSFQNCNSSINSMMNDIVKVLNLQFSVNNFIWKIADFFRGKTQRSPSRKQSKQNSMKLKVLAGYNRFKSDNVFFIEVEVAETSDKYENKQFPSFQNCNSSIISMMNDIVKPKMLQFSVENIFWKFDDYFRGKTQRSPSREQSKLSNLNLQIVAVSNRLYPFQKGWEFHKYY